MTKRFCGTVAAALLLAPADAQVTRLGASLTTAAPVAAPATASAGAALSPASSYGASASNALALGAAALSGPSSAGAAAPAATEAALVAAPAAAPAPRSLVAPAASIAPAITAAAADAPRAESAGELLFDGRASANSPASAAGPLALADFTPINVKPAPGSAFNASAQPLTTMTAHKPYSSAPVFNGFLAYDSTLAPKALGTAGGDLIKAASPSLTDDFEFAFAADAEVTAWTQTKNLWVARASFGIWPRRIDAGPGESFGPLDLSADGSALVYFVNTPSGGAVVLTMIDMLAVPAALDTKGRFALNQPPKGLALAPRTSSVAILEPGSSHGTGRLQLWDAARDLVRAYSIPAAPSRYDASNRTGHFPMVFSPDGSRLAMAGKPGEVLVYTVKGDSLDEVQTLSLPRSSDEVQTLAWSADGQKLVGSTWLSAWYWDFSSRQRVVVEDGMNTLGASWDEAAQALVWVARDGVYRATFAGGNASLSKVSLKSEKALLHPNARSLLTAEWDALTRSTTLRYVRLPRTPAPAKPTVAPQSTVAPKPPVAPPPPDPAQVAADAQRAAVANLRREIMTRASISNPAGLIRGLIQRLDGSDVLGAAAAKWLSELAAAGDPEAAQALEAEARRRQAAPRRLRTPLL